MAAQDQETKNRTQSHRAKRPEQPAGRLRRTTKAMLDGIFRNPIESAAVAAPPAAFLIFLTQGLMENRHSLLHDFTPAQSLELILGATILGLLARMTFAEPRANKDDVQGVRLAKTVAEISARVADMLEAQNHFAEHQEELMASVVGLAVKQNQLTIPRKNTEQVWMNLAPGSVYTTGGGPFLLDLERELRPDGKIAFVPNVGRLRATMVSRFHPETALQRANHIMFIGDADGEDVPVSVEQHLTVYRALRQIGESEGIDLLLDDIPRFYPVEVARPPMCFFLGEYLINGVRLPFVNSYKDHAAMYRVPTSLLDDEVQTSYLPNEIAKHEQLARYLMSMAPALTLAEMEHRYGGRVAIPVIRTPAGRRRRVVTIEVGVTDFGDGSFRV